MVTGAVATLKSCMMGSSVFLSGRAGVSYQTNNWLVGNMFWEILSCFLMEALEVHWRSTSKANKLKCLWSMKLTVQQFTFLCWKKESSKETKNNFDLFSLFGCFVSHRKTHKSICLLVSRLFCQVCGIHTNSFPTNILKNILKFNNFVVFLLL